MPTPDLMPIVLTLLLIQGGLGAFDTIYHHELTEGLASRPSARLELRIHALRAMLYGVVFGSIAWVTFQGLWVWAIAGVVAVEVGLTLWDFVQEDASRKLPATERVLHTVLAINGGAMFGLYAVQLADAASLPSGLAWADYGWLSGVLSLLAVGVMASGLRDGWAAHSLGQQAAQSAVKPNPFTTLQPALPQQTLLITGGTGFIGQALVTQLLAGGHSVTLWVRDPLKAATQFQGRVRCVTALEQLHADDHFDAVINLAGTPVVGPRWTARRQATLLASRVGVTQGLLAWLARTTVKPATWIQASAIGYYGVRPPEERLTESSARGGGFMSELCVQWEAAAAQASTFGVRQVTLRLGVVFGSQGALPPLVMPHRFGLGGCMGDGRQMMSWVHLDDVLGAIAQGLKDARMTGIYNTVAPEAVSQGEFARTVGALLHRPVWLHLPAALLRWPLGEMAQLFVDGQRVVPARLMAQGFVFQQPTLRGALKDLL